MTNHECLHEDKIMGQSRAIERLNAELQYKKERLDDLKEDNKRMEHKIDDIKDCVNQLIINSNSNDSELEARLVAIETRQENLEQKVDENKKDGETRTNQMFVKAGLLISAISIAIGLVLHFI